MINFPEFTGTSKMFDKPIYLVEYFGDAPDAYYKIIGYNNIGDLFGVYIGLESQLIPFFSISGVQWPVDYFKSNHNYQFKEIDYEKWREVFNEAIEELK